MITSPTNSKIKYTRRLQSERRFREREQTFVVEGTRWLAELGHFNVRPQFVLYTEAWLNTETNRQLLLQFDPVAQPINDQLMTLVSDTESPAGVLAVVPIHPKPLPENCDLFLILDEVTNPGNLGTMLRTAAAAGVDAVLLAPGCVDEYNPKVVRGGMGAHLRLAIHRTYWPEIRSLTSGVSVWLAAAGGERRYTAVDWRQPSALIIGSEAGGAGEEARQLAWQRIHIPMYAATESLNAAVATGIILFEAVRQRNKMY